MASARIIVGQKRSGVKVEAFGESSVIWIDRSRPELIGLALIALNELATRAEAGSPPASMAVTWCAMQPRKIRKGIVRAGVFPRELVGIEAKWRKFYDDAAKSSLRFSEKRVSRQKNRDANEI